MPQQNGIAQMGIINRNTVKIYDASGIIKKLAGTDPKGQ